MCYCCNESKLRIEVENSQHDMLNNNVMIHIASKGAECLFFISVTWPLWTTFLPTSFRWRVGGGQAALLHGYGQCTWRYLRGARIRQLCVFELWALSTTQKKIAGMPGSGHPWFGLRFPAAHTHAALLFWPLLPSARWSPLLPFSLSIASCAWANQTIITLFRHSSSWISLVSSRLYVGQKSASSCARRHRETWACYRTSECWFSMLGYAAPWMNE